MTGAGGFVGRSLSAALVADGWEVVAAGRAPRPDAPGLDVTRADAVHRLVEALRPRVVVNLAAIAHRKRERITTAEYDAVNHLGVAHLLDAAQECGVERVVQFGSASVYGEEGRTEPVREDAERRPVGAYARSKADAEDRCFAVDPARLACVVFRFPALYAPGWLLDVRKRAYLPGTGGRLLLEVGGDAALHSLCALDGAVWAAVRAARGEVPHGVYNVADREPWPQAEIARIVGAVDGVSRRVRLPRGLAAIPLGAARLLPGATGRQVRSHAWKLLRGLVLDTARADAAGIAGRGALCALVAALPPE